MPEIVKPVPGSFCWVELQTGDPAAAKPFYQQLLGWNTTDMPMAEPYIMADIGGKHVGGMAKLPDAAKKMGAPNHWLSYVAVEDAKAAADKATKLGGTVLFGPANIGPGIMTVIRDPADGVFAVWQTLQSMGTFLYGEPGALTWNELITTNVNKAGEFYTGMFGWKPEPMQMEGGYTYIQLKNGDAMVGGMMAQPPHMAGAPSVWNAYFAVADCDATVAKATTLGGKTLVPAMDIPGVGRFAVLADPQAAAFSVIKTMPMPG